MTDTKEAGMVERVARELCRASGLDADRDYSGRTGWKMYAGHARAVLEAMHEPDDGMLAPFHAGPPGMVLVARGVWQAMITAAIAQDPPHAV